MLPFLLVFLAIYAPFIYLDGRMVDIQAAFFVAVILLAAVGTDISGLVRNRISMIFLVLLWALIVYGLLTGLFVAPHRGFPHASLRVVRALLTFVGCYAVLALIARYRRQPIGSIPLADYVFFSITAHAVIMIVQFFSPPFRDAVYEYTINRDMVFGARLYYSMAGLTSGGGAQLSVFQSIGVLLVPLMFRARPQRPYPRKVVVAGGVLCFFSVLITGRSGLLVILFFLPLMVLMLGRTIADYKKAVVSAAVFVSVLLSGLLILDVSGELSDEGDGANPVVALAAAVFRAQAVLFGDDHTLELLSSHHLQLPEDVATLLVGNPRLIENDQNGPDRILDSDIGYVRILFGYGAAGSLLHYAFYALALWLAAIVYRRGGAYRDHAAFSIVVTLLFLFFNSKEVFVLTRIGFSITSLSTLLLAFQLPARSSMPVLRSDADARA